MAWMQTALGGPEIQEVVYAASLKYVLVACTPGATQQQLQELQPDFVLLKQVDSGSNIAGVIVTCAGESLQQDWLLHPCIEARLICHVYCTSTCSMPQCTNAGRLLHPTAFPQTTVIKSCTTLVGNAVCSSFALS